MRLTTLCYIEKDEKYLMLHRTKKKKDENHDKWIGVGGKFEAGESPDECVIREVKEETGLTLTKYQFRGIVTFCSDEWEDEYMHLFTATEFEGNLIECNENMRGTDWRNGSSLHKNDLQRLKNNAEHNESGI